MSKQKLSLAAFHRRVVKEFTAQGLRVPARNTVAFRVSCLDPVETARRRMGGDKAHNLSGADGAPPPIRASLEQVQIDHTIVDLIVMDEHDRQPIGRLYLTVAIDSFTRCVIGLVVTLEAPSASSVGFCLAHGVCDKRAWTWAGR